ncbi:P-loop containing nucleoside triphosphate hydrolase protein [Suillus paluster]|uniref:P-loop containing nucleoside triphosphate hydrolase protein n=1 Tax=Suillus paluster TaxID=48578 RepID=UPI001B8815BF|nr:P-loop containing nucleoside triphosphate hydrolase protein [Suillus paluster]KAG1745354.1 P-loop containing nucleoside triphosphate hydrolase protein [Suillus paluster]
MCSSCCVLPTFMSRNKQKDIVLTRETVASNASLANLMTGDEGETTSPNMRCHTPQCTETVALDDEASKAFDPIRLEELHLGIKEYPIPSTITARHVHKNIVLFGETGVGKSSLVNLMAGQEIARTSPDAQRCTLHSKEYTVGFGGESYKVFDTIGLEEPQLGIQEYLESVENAYRLIKELDRQGGIDLLLFCIRAGRVTATLQMNYRLFHEFLCEKKVPIVLAITHLEEERTMEDWWDRNHGTLRRSNIHVAGHACLTAADKQRLKYPRLYEESRVTIRNLVKEHTADDQKQVWIGGDKLFMPLMRKLKELHLSVRKKDLVSRLTKRCGISVEVATHLADIIKKDVVEVVA